MNRALFLAGTWNKNCLALSGGERIWLYLCCMMLSNNTPDILPFDEPTNNLDFASLAILTDTVYKYRGTFIDISHDSHFAQQVGVAKKVVVKH